MDRAWGSLASIEANLRDRYQLAGYKRRETHENYVDNLLYLEILEFCLKDHPFPPKLEVVDVGPRDWYYAPALWHYFTIGEHGPREANITGVEIDPYLIYWDGHSRRDFAEFYIREFPGMQYEVGDFLDYEKPAHVITMFHPFLRPYEHLEGGLPLDSFHPKEMISHAYSLLQPGGALVLVTFDYETEPLIDLLNELGLEAKKRGDYQAVLAERPKRHAAIVIKP